MTSKTQIARTVKAVSMNDIRGTRAEMLRRARHWKAKGDRDFVKQYVIGAFKAHEQLMFWKKQWSM